MKKFSAFVSLVSISFAGICDKVDLKKHVPVPSFRVESKREIYGLCEMIININNQLIPVYATKDFIISGEMFSYKKQITQEILEKVRKEITKRNLKKLEKLTYVSYKPQNVSDGKYFYFISDPDCPYCNRIKKKVKELASKEGWEIRLIWYPLPFHPYAKQKAISFLCENKTFEDYLEGNYGKKQCDKGKEAIDKNLRTLSFVRGTPTFIFPDGDVIVGANIKRLEQKLKGGNDAGF
ncbi:MAG TPA: DsbC family protein [Aquifex aeolicus]|nr:DsbC family protein [Aquifex aeolicus]